MWTKKPKKISHNHVNSLHATCVGLIMSGLLYELLLWLDSSSWLVHNGRKRSHNVTSELSPLRQQIRCGLSASRVSPHHASPALPPWCLRERRRSMRATTPEGRRYARWPFPTLSISTASASLHVPYARTTSWKRWQIPCLCCGWD